MPKIIGDSLAGHRDLVRERLFGALLRLIVARGYDAITLAEIAAEAGVGRTAVYNHFPDKESVLLAFTRHQTEAYLERLRTALAELPDAGERLVTLMRMQMTELAGQHTQLAGLGPVLSEAGRVQIGEHVAPMVGLLTGTLRDAVAENYLPEQDIDSLASLVSAVMNGRMLHGLEGQAFDAAIARATEFAIRGAGGRPAPDGRLRQLGDDSV